MLRSPIATAFLGEEFETAPLERRAFALVLAAYAFIVGIGVAVHEPWWDEAQAWLLARDASLPDLLTTWLAYEGHPPAWYLILAIPAKLGAPYKSINFASALVAITGVAILLRLREVPPLLRATLPFTFYAAYQYTVVSRSYVLIPPLLFAIVACYRKRDESVLVFFALLSLLSLVSVHGACLAIAFVVLFAMDLWCGRLSRQRISLQQLAAAAVLLTFTDVVLMIVLWPRADLVTGPFVDLHFRFSKMAAIAASVLAANFFGNSTPLAVVTSMGLAALLVLWLYFRGTLTETVVLFVALLPVSSMYFARWHEGLFFWVVVFAILLPASKAAPRAMAAAGWTAVAIMLALHCSWTARSLLYDARARFTGSRDAAAFIRDHGMQRRRLFGAGVRCIELQPYFRSNIFANYSAPHGAAFWDWSRNNPWPYPAPGPDLRAMAIWIQNQVNGRPDYIIASSGFRADRLYSLFLRRRRDYREIARFGGGLFWKDAVIERIDFALFQRQ